MTFRRLLSVLVVLLTLYVLPAAGQLAPLFYGLTGKIVWPNGTLFNGTLSVMLARPTAVNVCTNPVQIVAQKPAVFTITNGTIVGGTAAQFLTNVCLTPSIPYFAQISDASNRMVYSDNWFFPALSVSNIDVGTLSDTSMPLAQSGGGTNSTGTPIVVAIPNAIVGAPIGNQTIAQPGGTALTVNNLVVSGTFSSTNSISASITGNAATATALAATPSQCGTGYFATGITIAGNANCSNTFPTNSSYATLTVMGGSRSYSSSAGYFNYGLLSHGEQDFIDSPGAGSGGWAWFLYSNTSTPVASMDTSGNLTVNSLIGSVTGNASTATALASTPSQCSAGQISTGISANGNANCSVSTFSTGSNANGVWEKDPIGTITQRGTVIVQNSGSTLGTGILAFPVPFTTLPTLTLGAGNTPDGGQNALTYYFTGLTINGATIVVRCAVNVGGSGCSALSNSIPITWIAIGN